MSLNYLDFLDDVVGCGSDFRNMFDEVGMGTRVVRGEEKIYNSIFLILSTRKGERLFQPKFGSDLYKAIFEPNTLMFEDLVKHYVREALSIWEKRIRVLNVEVGSMSSVDGEYVVPVTIFYVINGTNITGSYVYPFNVSDRGDVEIASME